jgi:hypothetical protein
MHAQVYGLGLRVQSQGIINQGSGLSTVWRTREYFAIRLWSDNTI